MAKRALTKHYLSLVRCGRCGNEGSIDILPCGCVCIKCIECDRETGFHRSVRGALNDWNEKNREGEDKDG